MTNNKENWKARVRAEYVYNRLFSLETEKEELLERLRYINRELKKLNRIK